VKIIVLGGNGFIGTHLVRALSKDCEVVSVGRTPTNVKLPEVRYVCDTIDNTRLLAELVADADTIIHLASDTTPGSSELQPSIEATNNLLPTLRLLELLQSYHDVHLIYVSSGGAVYGANREGLHSEDSVISPPAYYGAGKAAIEMFLNAYHQQTSNTVTIVRPSNVYGPGQRAKRTFGLIPTIFQCLDENRPLHVWGDGSNLRDYLFIDDLVILLKNVVQHRSGRGLEILNAGYGTAYSILQVCQCIEEITGKKLSIQFHPRRRVDLEHVALDSRRAAESFGWEASVSLSEGLQLVANDEAR